LDSSTERVGKRFQNIHLMDLFTKQWCFKKHWNFTKICRLKLWYLWSIKLWLISVIFIRLISLHFCEISERSCCIFSTKADFALSGSNLSKNVPKPVQFAIFYLQTCCKEGFKPWISPKFVLRYPICWNWTHEASTSPYYQLK